MERHEHDGLLLHGTGNYVYQGCFQDGNGPYRTSSYYNAGRILPAALTTRGWTIDQCARAAAKRGYEVFGVEVDGECYFGALADVAQMTTKMDDAQCNNVPCVGGVDCVGWAMKVFSIGATPMHTHVCPNLCPFAPYPKPKVSWSISGDTSPDWRWENILTPRLAKKNVLGGTLLATVAIGKKIIVRDIAICWRQKNENGDRNLWDWIATMATGRIWEYADLPQPMKNRRELQ
jgi:hypothetical protein